jgi:hypothetical protein
MKGKGYDEIEELFAAREMKTEQQSSTTDLSSNKLLETQVFYSLYKNSTQGYYLFRWKEISELQ